VIDFFVTFMHKNDLSILTGDWHFCYIYALKMTNSISFLMQKCNKNVSHLIILKLSFLMQKCNKNVSHLLILNGHFYCINVTKTSVTSKTDQFNINRWLTFLLHLCSLCSKKNQLNINRWLTFCYIFTVKRIN
jgi:hypothetical protein